MNRGNLHEPILIVEDDRNTASLVATYLEREGFATLIAYDGKHGLELARRHRPIFVILDLMLPQVDGREVCRTLRGFSEVPVLMLTARGEEVDRIVGFSLGADDYVVKPFSPRELVERVKAILRRTRGAPDTGQIVLSCDGLVLDPEKHTVTLNGRPVALTPSGPGLLPGRAAGSHQRPGRGGDRPGDRRPHRQATPQDRAGPFDTALHFDGARHRLPPRRSVGGVTGTPCATASSGSSSASTSRLSPW
jgi:CheY-like chemotaxis protein